MPPAPALASNAFLASLGVRHAIGAVANQRRGAVVEESAAEDMGGVAPPHDLEEKLKRFERRRGVNHMQIFLERLVAEILETQTATRGLEHLLHSRKILEECIRNLQVMVQKKNGRDPKGLMQLRSSFLMLSLADRESRLPQLKHKTGSEFLSKSQKLTDVSHKSHTSHTATGKPTVEMMASNGAAHLVSGPVPDGVSKSMSSEHDPSLSALTVDPSLSALTVASLAEGEADQAEAGAPTEWPAPTEWHSALRLYRAAAC
jgi:hypothetical protein